MSCGSKKQRIVAFTTELEFIATSIAVQEAIWLKMFLNHLVLTASQESLTIYSDSQSSIAYVEPWEVHIWIRLCFDDQKKLGRKEMLKGQKFKGYSSRKHSYSSKFKF